MRALWERFIQSIFGESDSFQGERLGWQEPYEIDFEEYWEDEEDF